MNVGNSTGWDSGVDVQLLIHRNSIDFQHIDKRIGLLEVHTTKISWRGLLTVVWASKYYKKGSKYYKKGEGIKRYTSTPPNIVVEHTPQVSIFGGVVVVP